MSSCHATPIKTIGYFYFTIGASDSWFGYIDHLIFGQSITQMESEGSISAFWFGFDHIHLRRSPTG